MSILLAQSDEGGARVSAAEFENMFWLFAVAGNETLRNGLPGGCVALLEHPQAQDALRADPALLPVAADEMLRWWTPVMTFRRTAAEDCQIGGQPIRSGDKVVVSFTSANRDDAVFADPGRFDVRRQPNPHLVFGHGPHFCLGAHLARTQMRALFAEVLARTSVLESAGRRPTCAPTSSAASRGSLSPGLPSDLRRSRSFQRRCSAVQRQPGTVVPWRAPVSQDHSPWGPPFPSRLITSSSPPSSPECRW